MNKHGSLNRIYRIVWNKAKGMWMAVSELAKGQGKGGCGRRKLSLKGLVLLVPLSLLLNIEAQASPTGGQITSGTGSISQSGTTTTINQGSQNLSLNWKTYNVAGNETVNYQQPNSSSVAVNRILDTNGSQILGHINANGQIYLINPNGILFGKGAQVNVGGLVASTLDTTDNKVFSGNGTGSIVNNGSLTAASGGYVALLANHVSNNGIISATLGTVALAAGNQVTLDFSGDQLLSVQVDKGALDALAENKQLIEANGGTVLMTAKAADALTTAAVNNTGLIQAQTLVNRNGHILLLGDMQSGTVNVDGTLDASAPTTGDGGAIETSAAHVKIADGTTVTTKSATGSNGTWLIDPADFTIGSTATGTISGGTPSGDVSGATLGTALGAGNVTILSSQGSTTAGSGNVNVNDNVSWGANTLTLTASNNVNINAVMTASGTAVLALNPNTANGTELASGTGTVNVALGANGFTGRVDFTGTNTLSINGTAYTIITTLGAAGSTTGTDLQGMNGNLAGHYALGANIDASATSTWNSNAGFTPIGSIPQFTGVFDGLGHTISNLTISLGTNRWVGLFGYTNGATISNVGLVGGTVTGGNYVGDLVGTNSSGTVLNAYATGSVSGSIGVGGLVGDNIASTISNAYASGNVTGGGGRNIGGLAGYNDSTISNAYATGSVTGVGDNVGGLVGLNYGGTISNAYASGTVTETGLLSKDAGGLVGLNYGGTISNAYASGSVNASSSSAVGGLVGNNAYNGTIIGLVANAYASGSVTGGSQVGGLVGANYGLVSLAYATGNVSGSSDIGGLVGVIHSTGVITSVYATGSVSGSSYFGGLVGYNSNTTNGIFGYGYWDTTTTSGTTTGIGGGTTTGATGLTTSQLASAVPTYFASIHWGNAGNQTTPYLLANASLSTVGGSVILGTDTSATPTHYNVILSMTQLQNINSTGLAGNYVLGTNLTDPGSGFTPIGNSTTAFTGSFNGLGYTINNLTIASAAGNTGLFGYTSGATITNVGLVGGSVSSTAGNDVGMLVGYMGGGTVSNSYATGSVSGAGGNIGDLIGANIGGTISSSHATGSVAGGTYSTGGLVGGTTGPISNSYATGNVTGATKVGGLTGWDNSSVTNSYATGSVSGTGNYVGGLVGYGAAGINISNSYATGNVSGLSSVGGLVGRSSGSISSSYATGNVSGVNCVGGLVGYGAAGISISNSYATGNVSGAIYVGGLAGKNSSGNISNSYATGNVSGTSDVGGLVGLNSGAISKSYWDNTTYTGAGIGGGTLTGATGLSTAQLASALPTGFSSSVWDNAGNQTTPYLLSNASFSTVSGSVILGTDTSATPTYYNVILSMTQLQNINSTGLAGKYVLGTNLTDPGSGFTPIGNSTTQFTGTFDGLGHTISNLTIASATGNTGLFGDTNGATISNVGLVGGSVSSTAGNDIGMLVGNMNNGTVSNSYATGSVSGAAGNTGDLVGANIGGTISNSYATGNVTGATYVGGLVGVNYGAISNSYVSGGSVSGTTNVGGFVGANAGGAGGDGSHWANGVPATISNSYVYAVTVSGTGNNIGGFVGWNLGGNGGNTVTGFPGGTGGAATIINSYVNGLTVSSTGGNNIGGFVGLNQDGVAGVGSIYSGSPGGTATISTSYASTGSVSGASSVGGLVGNNAGTISTSFWDTTTSGTSTGIGAGTLAGATSMATADMMTQANFTSATTANGSVNPNWDVAGTWVMYDGHTYPLLRSFMTPLTVTSSAQSKTYDGTSTVSLNSPTYSVTGADTSGHLFGLTTAYGSSAINAGTYSTGDLWSDQQGYIIDQTGVGTLTINPAALTITGNTASATYNGAAQSNTGFTTSTLYGTDSVTSVSGLASGTNAGTYSDTLSAATGSGLANYTISYVNGGLTINQAALTITGNTATATYNGTAQSNTGFTTGTLYGTDSVTSVSGLASGANAGSYTDSLSGASGSGLSNYSISYVNGSLTIGTAALTITGNTSTTTYNGAAQTNGYTTGTLYGTDTVTGVSGLASGTNVGTYADTLSAATGSGISNYTITYVNGSLTVNPATLTITANNATQIHDGTAWSGGNGVTYSGFVGTDTLSVLGGTLAYGGTSQGATSAGSYTIIPTGLSATNYSIGYVNGTLTIVAPITSNAVAMDALTSAEQSGSDASLSVSGDILPTVFSMTDGGVKATLSENDIFRQNADLLAQGTFIQFGTGSAAPINISALNKIANAAVAADVTLMVIGYTDSTGSADYNNQLSLRRAERVRDLLTAQGVNVGIMKLAGDGEANPIGDNNTAEGRAKNRRVLIKGIGNDDGI